MNDVPVLFFEGVVSHTTRKETLLAGRTLSGLAGHFASEAYVKRCRHTMLLRNGQLEEESYFNCENQRVYIGTKLSSKHLHYTGLVIRADEEEYGTDPKAMERVLSATKGKHVLLCLETPNISEEIAECVESIRFVYELQVDTEITSLVLKMLRLLVEKNTLTSIQINEDVDIEVETAQLLADLLKQKQFHRLYLHGKYIAALKDIIASWKENSEEMVGKMIYCREEFSKLQLSSTEFPFQECTEEEERKAKRAYLVSANWSYITRISVLRNQDGRAVYCFSRSSLVFKSVFVFV